MDDKPIPTSANATVAQLAEWPIPWPSDDVTIVTHIGTITAKRMAGYINWTLEREGLKVGPLPLGQTIISPRTLADFLIYVGSYHLELQSECALLCVRLQETFGAIGYFQ